MMKLYTDTSTNNNQDGRKEMAIAVLLSAYNGEKYIREQMDSILSQEDVSVRLFVRDDGSTDKTSEIIQEYIEKDQRITFINMDNIINVGIQKSFFSLLEYVYQKTDVGYFSFADQDDVWKPQKLKEAYDKLSSLGSNGRGKLYFSSRTFVDKDLNLIRNETLSMCDDSIELFWKNGAPGCTSLMDRELVEYVLRVKTQSKLIHDSWIFRIARAIGTPMYCDEKSYILYRQHEENAVGLRSITEYQYHESTWYWLKRFVPMLFEERDDSLLLAMREIYEGYSGERTQESKSVIEIYLRYRRSLIAKYKLITHPAMKKRSKKERMIWTYRVLFNWVQ